MVTGGLIGFTELVRCTPLWPAAWLHVVAKSRGSKLADVQRIWEIYDASANWMFGLLLLRLLWLMRIGLLEVHARQARTGSWYCAFLGSFDLVVLGLPRFVVPCPAKLIRTVLVFLELISRFEFDFRRRGTFFLMIRIFGVFKVQSRAMRLCMCACAVSCLQTHTITFRMLWCS